MKKGNDSKRKDAGNGSGLNFEAQLWAAADKMRGHMDASEYKHVALGLIFLKYISEHLRQANALTRLGISAVALGKNRRSDQWLFPEALLPKLLSGELRVPQLPD